MKSKVKTEIPDLILPVLPLRDVVVYPHMVIPLFIGRKKSINAIEFSMECNKQIMLITQKEADTDNPTTKDIYTVGTMANILQLLKLPDDTIKLLVEGTERAEVIRYTKDKKFIGAELKIRETTSSANEKKVETLARLVLNQFSQYVKLNKKIPSEVLQTLTTTETLDRLAYTIATHTTLSIENKQKILEINDIYQQMECLMTLLEEELDILKVEKRIRGRVQQQMEKSQREYYLNEQMKAIQKELGDIDNIDSETQNYRKNISKANMPAETEKKALVELGRLNMMAPMSSEAAVVRNYLDWLIGMPWTKKSRTKRSLGEASKILEKNHYGLEKVKERIIEYLAVQLRTKKVKGTILCLVGPPGVGKTSLGKSIASATGRKFTRMSLGGVRDEAEIRGHRRTYIGAQPGKFIQNLSKIGVRNPLFLLDEIDKMSTDFRGDPASALLEVLDSEQNSTFTDHYIEVEFDLSDVMFVCTANSLLIPPALLDRMEVIRIPGYTEDEKLNIATQYLMPKAMAENGLASKEMQISENAILDTIRYYTREAGVRNLEREIMKISRKVVKSLVLSKNKAKKATKVDSKGLEQYLGVRKFRYGIADEENRVGQVNGLAWTEAGGELLTVESATMPGKGRLSHTGQLGDVMKESVQAAMTIVRSRSEVSGVAADFHEKHDVHVHIPEGATPKDGPSAGIAVCTAITSAITKIPVRSNVAMTGEITLRGEVLAIGGLKEKLLAAQRAHIKTVIIPKDNAKDLKEIPKNITAKLDIRPLQWIDEVLKEALTEMPVPTQYKDKLTEKIPAGKRIPSKTGRTTRVHRH
ncbi:MAG: endopeptidase La [Chromatiales bacterium]|nr:endopeptidase La [Chromatiales bacterium]